jgi:hypothetical protein
MKAPALGATADEDAEALVTRHFGAVQVVAALNAEGIDFEADVALRGLERRERFL